MNKLTGRKARRWLEEISAIVYDNSVDAYTAYMTLRTKLMPLQPKGKVVVKKREKPKHDFQPNQLRSIDDMIRKETGKISIPAVRYVRASTGWGLKDAKDWVESRAKQIASQPRRRSSRASFRAV